MTEFAIPWVALHLQGANRRGAGGERKAPTSCCVSRPSLWGLTRGLRRGRLGCRPREAVLSFVAKESTKERTRHGDSRGGPPRCASRASVCGSPFGAILGLGSLRSPFGKRLLLPILPAGLAMSRAMELDSFHQLLERARARLFPPSKWAGLFPSAAYRRSAPPQLTLGILK